MPTPAYTPRDPTASVLYTVVREHVETFRVEAARLRDGLGLPRFVDAEFDAFLRCGFLAGGFARFRCDACRTERLVAFSCKGRGFCPSCGGRRMAERAAHLVDHVLPDVPVRQWVLTLPHRLRYLLAWRHDLCRAVARLLHRAVERHLRTGARERGVRHSRGCSVAVLQRFGGSLNLNVHVHALVLDGVFTRTTGTNAVDRGRPPRRPSHVEPALGSAGEADEPAHGGSAVGSGASRCSQGVEPLGWYHALLRHPVVTNNQLQHVTTALSGRYRVVREIGRGGMATVYLADDPRHHRQVAIKVFDPGYAEALGKDRFLREIEVTAGLTHPHILPLYDSGLADGLAYYVMPYVEGKTFREHLQEKGRLPLDEALRIVRGVADALAFAHRKGIVHRDIKPENVLLQAGHALVADFGIARALTLAGDVALTQTGMVVGTPLYMSPEQTVGDSAVDGRSDIYSLACLLFEALTGSPPFKGGTSADVARRRLTEAAPRLRTSSADVPAAIDEAVAKALAREPGDRFATADAFAAALLRSGAAPGAAVATETKGLVVLPFTNLSPDPENEFFADGLTEEVIADLSGISALRVISRTSAMRFKGTDKDLRTIARELNVRYVLEGSVRRAGSSLRVTAQLVEADTDSQVWAEKYSGSIDDVFAIQEEISRKIVKALQVRLSDTESRQVAERPIDNPVAYDCYLQAHHEMLRFTAESLDRAQALADRGLALMGDNPLLLATRGMVSWYYLNFSIRPEERYLDEAASFATRSLDQDPEAFLGIFLRGLVAAKRGDIEAAVRDIRRAHDLKPGGLAHLELMRWLFTAGQPDETVFEAGARIDPLNPLYWTQLALARFTQDRPAAAERASRRGIELSDRGTPVRFYAGMGLVLAGRQEEAIAVLDEVASTLADSPYGSISAFIARALQGDANGARHVTPLLEQSARWVEYLALFLAGGYALIGRRDDALRWLKEAVRLGFINYPFFTRAPFLESLRGDAEFQALMQQVERRWRAFEA